MEMYHTRLWTQLIKNLEHFEKMVLISNVDDSDFASPTVYLNRKNQKIRLCADFSVGLNDHLKDHTYLLPSSEYNFSQLNVEFFSIIDLFKAYLQVKVNEESSELLMINAKKGITCEIVSILVERLPSVCSNKYWTPFLLD